MPQTTELQASTLDALPTAALIASKGLVVHANPPCLALLDAEQASQVLQRPMTDFIHPLDLSRAGERVQKLGLDGLIGNANQSSQYRIQTCRSHTRTVLLASATAGFLFAWPR